MAYYRSGYSYRFGQRFDSSRPKPWEQEIRGQYVCRECHTYGKCDHASDETALVLCSKCGSGKECVPCKRYQPKKGERDGLHRSRMPLIWRDTGRWLCVRCRPEHEASTSPGKKIMVCEKCRDVPQECSFYYPRPFEQRRRRW